MDPVSLILAALVAGASSGVTDAAGQAIKDAYASLKRVLLHKVAAVPAGDVAVEQHEADPETWKGPVSKAVRDSGAADDPEVVAAAQRVLELTDPQGARAGVYQVTITASGERSVAGQTITGNITTGDTHPAS